MQLKDANGNVVETITIPIPEGVTIEPGQSYTFTGDIPKPSTPGTYTLTAKFLTSQEISEKLLFLFNFFYLIKTYFQKVKSEILKTTLQILLVL